MIIAIDYTPAIRQQAGIGRIIRGQIAALCQICPEWEIRLFVAGPVAAQDRADAPLPLYTTPISERNMVRLWHRLNSRWPRVEHFTGGPLSLFHATDFVLAPSHAHHKMVTVHDLAFLFYPEAAMPSLHRYLNVVVPRSLRRADHLLADSYHTARDLHEQWQIPQEQITVVHGAVDHEHFQRVTDSAALMTVRQRYGVGDRPFILGLSTLQPRKNFARLIDAFAIARQEGKLPHRLVIGGGKGWLYDEIFAKVQDHGLTEDVLLPGYIADADLPALYSAAEFFAYPSLYEGFGLPVLEALACGTPVLTADNSSLPETGGPAVLYVQATDIADIAAGLLKLAGNDSLQQQMRSAGYQHVQKFTWQRSAQQLRAAYTKVLAR
ncbi:MAG TPA: glycosyltransferase family 1 protein [Caldilineaceae bacterium]|nr:glycosyltransferase family 1 protein [Caldilineaceae bacterium]